MRIERWKFEKLLRDYVSSTDTIGDVLLKQMVQYASNQWDEAARFSTRAGGIMAVGGSILVGSIALLSGSAPTTLATRVAGWLLVAASIILAGWATGSSGWKTPPNLSDANLAEALLAKPEAVKQGLVLDYADACRQNNRRLKGMRSRQDLALVILTIGTLLVGLAYFTQAA